MILWTVCRGYDYEGYAEPLGVFYKEEVARAVAERVRNDKYVDFVDVVPLRGYSEVETAMKDYNEGNYGIQ